jgi:hypothetical protein
MSSSKAAGESKPESYPLGHVEDFDSPRTTLADFFSILLGASAFWTKGGFFCCLAFFGSQRKELFALSARPDFKVGDSLVVDVSG